MQGTTDDSVDVGVPFADVLMAYADAAVRRDGDLAERRAAVESALGAEAVVDAAATVANYQRMVRIADGCGIPLDEVTEQASAEWRESLGVNEYYSALNTYGEEVAAPA